MNNGNSNSGSGSGGTAREPTAREYIVYHLWKEGRSTIHEIATAIGYSRGHTRTTAKELRADGLIEGEKTDPVIGCRVNGRWIILTSNRDEMIRQLQQVAPSAAARARAQAMTVEEVHDLLKKHAQVVAPVSRRWEFWVEPANLAASTQAQSGAQAD